jgi:hypothetical protein
MAYIPKDSPNNQTKFYEGIVSKVDSKFSTVLPLEASSPSTMSTFNILDKASMAHLSEQTSSWDIIGVPTVGLLSPLESRTVAVSSLKEVIFYV